MAEPASAVGVNDEAVQAWNTVLFEKFRRFRHVLTIGLAEHGDEALRRHPPAEGTRVLDLGCGFGDTTLQLARALGAHGEAVGVDCAPSFVEIARAEARQAGVGNARFLVADVQTDALGGPYATAFARFGTMFFASPVAALRNVRRSLQPGGELVMVVWRRRQDNDWVYRAEQCVRAIVPDREAAHDPQGEPTCGPGPFSMAGADMVSDQLIAAGFGRIGFERFDVDICIGRDLDDAVEFAMELGPAGEILRLAGEEGERLRPQVMANLRQALAPLAREGGVFGGSSSWIVTARAG